MALSSAAKLWILGVGGTVTAVAAIGITLKLMLRPFGSSTYTSGALVDLTPGSMPDKDVHPGGFIEFRVPVEQAAKQDHLVSVKSAPAGIIEDAASVSTGQVAFTAKVLKEGKTTVTVTWTKDGKQIVSTIKLNSYIPVL